MKMDRLLGILTMLLQHDRLTAPQLAERFEVSRRTIARDIDALCMSGIPVITQQGVGGGISIAQGYKLDKSVLTTQELGDIIAALRGIGSVSEPSRLERTLDKLMPGGQSVVSLKDSIVIELAANDRDRLTQVIAMLREAIQGSQQLQFVYHSPKGEFSRRVEPALILFQWGAWYLFGYCLDRQDWRTFKLSRMMNVQLIDEPFAPREVPMERTNFHALHPDEKQVVALFDPSIKYLLIDSYGMQCFTQQPDGKLLFQVGYTNHDYMLSWLLQFGDKAKVLSPASIAEGIARIAANLVAQYKT
ncbi:YafY family transcriptional regulator [Eubacteriales bacterium OttesenSCG-928-N13]|nr:YafY family transcriptional regulator [Eubacteriales bacterium OttesenSCG-928-N13]